ncbi:MAG: preprotein translocase subunit SecG [Candidatus Shapirobacteria bacterium]|jgi:protein translocase SecG subunit
MKTTLIIFQIILSLVLSVLIFLQPNDESNSRGNIMSSVEYQKRGWEKTLFSLTIICLILFLISSIIQTII